MLGPNRKILLRRLQTTLLFVAAWVAGACIISAGPAAPPQLRYVVIITRHGVRSPTWTNDRLNQYSAEPWPDWGVPPGYLTPHGRALMQLMGAYYRDWLLSQRLLTPQGCGDCGPDLHSCGYGPAHARNGARVGGDFAPGLLDRRSFGAGGQPRPVIQLHHGRKQHVG